MSWIALTTNDFLTAVASPELDALRTAATARAQPDPADEVAGNTIREIRGYVAGCSRNRLGPLGTIPQELKQAAIDIFRFRLTLRLPGVKFLQDDSRRTAYQDALTLLRKVSACSFAVEQPAEEDALDVNTGGAQTPAVGKERDRFAPERFNGVGP